MELTHIKNMEFESTEPRALNLSHIIQMIIICLAGLGVSILAFTIEIFAHK